MRDHSWKTENRSSDEADQKANFFELFSETPIPNEELLGNLGLYLNRQTLTRILFMQEIYKESVDIRGDVMDFGTRWGQNMALFANFRGIFEPYNHNRKIIGFDTFEGFPEHAISEIDGSETTVNDFNTTDSYDNYLRQIMEYHESESPISHIKKFEVIKGDVENTLEDYLDNNPQTIISLAYFDLDLYSPTNKSLELIWDKIPKGGIIGFDDLNTESWSGETQALDDVVGIDEFEIKRVSYNSRPSYIIKE
jgi:hypothetical protein